MLTRAYRHLRPMSRWIVALVFATVLLSGVGVRSASAQAPNWNWGNNWWWGNNWNNNNWNWGNNWNNNNWNWSGNNWWGNNWNWNRGWGLGNWGWNLPLYTQPVVYPSFYSPVVTTTYSPVITTYASGYLWAAFGPGWNAGWTLAQIQQLCQQYNQAYAVNTAVYNQYVQQVCNVSVPRILIQPAA